MEPRPNSRFTAALTIASATAARVGILTRNETMPACYGLALTDTNNFAAPWIAAQFSGLGRVKLIGTGSTTATHEREARNWIASISGSYISRWFFAQAPAPEDEDPEASENEEEAQAKPQGRNAPAGRKQSSTEENAEQLREGGTINPPLP